MSIVDIKFGRVHNEVGKAATAKHPVLTMSAVDMALARARRIALIDRDPAPVIGRGIHCREGRLIGHGRKVELVKHSTCDLSCCPCPCHHGGTP